MFGKVDFCHECYFCKKEDHKYGICQPTGKTVFMDRSAGGCVHKMTAAEYEKWKSQEINCDACV